jgi:hypothetical protein
MEKFPLSGVLVYFKYSVCAVLRKGAGEISLFWNRSLAQPHEPVILMSVLKVKPMRE